MINANHKTFDDLVFEDHSNVSNAVQARLDLGYNLEISVVSMKSESSGFGNLYGDASKGTYEVGVFHHDKMVPNYQVLKNGKSMGVVGTLQEMIRYVRVLEMDIDRLLYHSPYTIGRRDFKNGS
jgi:hypothetical protein